MRSSSEVFDHLKKVGFSPETVIDVGVAEGTPEIYEAFPEAYYVLVEAVEEYRPALEGLLKRIKGEYHLCALSREPGELDMLVREPFYSSTIQFDGDELKDRGAVRKVPVRTLEQILNAGEYARPIMLKTDCQGHDLDVIVGGGEALSDIDLIICEVPIYGPWGGGYEFTDYINALDERGFRLYDIWHWLYRPGDQRLHHLDLMFAKTEGPLRDNKLYTMGEFNVGHFSRKSDTE